MTWKTCNCGRAYRGVSETCGRCHKPLRSKQPDQQAGRKLEARAAKRRGGTRQPASGARPGRPGDFIEGEHLVEHKATKAASYRLTLAVWRKIAQEAALLGKEPVLVVNLQGIELEVRRTK